MTRSFSLAAATVLSLSPPQLIQTAADAGFQAAGLRLSPVRPGELAPPMLGDTPMMRETLARMRDTNVRVLDIEVFWLNGTKPVRDFLPFLEAGNMLGARYALTIVDVDSITHASELFDELCGLAAPLGISCALEFMSWIKVNTIKQAQEIISRSRRTDAFVLLDTLHLARSGGSMADTAAIHLSSLGYAQLCDAPARDPGTPEGRAEEAKFDRLMPGDGELPVRQFVDALPRTLPLSVEVPSRALEQRLSPFEIAQLALRKAKAIDSAVAGAAENPS